MKWLILLLVASALALRADDAGTNTVGKPAPPPPPVDEATVTHQGYPSARYQSLWTQSPFAVETPDEAPTESAEYSLVGVAEIDGVSYASLIEKQNQNHLLISTDKPVNGLALNSITHKPDGDTYATLTRDGQPLTLKLETVATGVMAPGVMPNAAPQMPGPVTPNGAVPFTQNIPMPGAGGPQSVRPLIRIRRPIIHVPARGPDGTVPQSGQPAPPPPPP